MVDPCHYTFVQTHKMYNTRVSHNAYYRLQVKMMGLAISVTNILLWVWRV